jgi:hypothetical protein
MFIQKKKTINLRVIKNISLQNYNPIGSEPALIKYFWTISSYLFTKIRVDFITNFQTFLNNNLHRATKSVL